jgi:hypothetical protein
MLPEMGIISATMEASRKNLTMRLEFGMECNLSKVPEIQS